MNTSVRASELPSGREFRNRLLLASGLLSAVATFVIAAYLFALLRLTREQWIGFVWINLASLPGVVRRLEREPPAVLAADRALPRPAAQSGARARRSRAGLRGGVEPGPAHADLGRLAGGCSAACWARPACACASRAIDWRGFATMLAAASSGGFVMCVFHYFMVKRLTEPMRNALAGEHRRSRACAAGSSSAYRCTASSSCRSPVSCS